MNKENNTKLTAFISKKSLISDNSPYTQIYLYGKKDNEDIKEFYYRIFDPLSDQQFTFMIKHDKRYVLLSSYFAPGLANITIKGIQICSSDCMMSEIYFNEFFADSIIVRPYAMAFMILLPKELHEQCFVLNDVSHNKDFCRQKFDLLRNAGVDEKLIAEIQDYQFGVVSQLLL